jgi:hypothetical protein
LQKDAPGLSFAPQSGQTEGVSGSPLGVAADPSSAMFAGSMGAPHTLQKFAVLRMGLLHMGQNAAPLSSAVPEACPGNACPHCLQKRTPDRLIV